MGDPSPGERSAALKFRNRFIGDAFSKAVAARVSSNMAAERRLAYQATGLKAAAELAARFFSSERTCSEICPWASKVRRPAGPNPFVVLGWRLRRRWGRGGSLHDA